MPNRSNLMESAPAASAVVGSRPRTQIRASSIVVTQFFNECHVFFIVI